MTDLRFKPVPHDHVAFLAKAHVREGFYAKYNALQFEYQIARQIQSQIRLVPRKS